jgi:hypothetical protein
MPLTKRQFELGVDEQIENWMREIYSVLAGDRNHAYDMEELFKRFVGNAYHYGAREKFARALEALVEIGTVELRKVVGTSYYTFYWEVDQSTWELKIAV